MKSEAEMNYDERTEVSNIGDRLFSVAIRLAKLWRIS